MKVNLFVNDDLIESSVLNFYLLSKKIKFDVQKILNIKDYKNNKNLIVFKKEVQIKAFNKILNHKYFSTLTNSCLFLPLNLNNNLFTNISFINYPIKYTLFEERLIDIFNEKKYFFKNLELKYDNNLFNTKTKKQNHLTEIESKIIKMLFSNKKVSKKSLNTKVLNQVLTLESKSLESHLYRLRVKLSNVDNKRKIVSIGNQGLKVI